MDAQFKVPMSDTEITALVNFIDHWNDVEQADQHLLDNIQNKLDQIIIKHREKASTGQTATHS